MKRVLLITSKNHLYREALVKRGYTVVEYNLPVSAGAIREIEDLPSCVASITEVMDGSVENRRDLYRALKARGQIICCAGSTALSDDMKSFLLDHGISDVLTGQSESRLVPYLAIIGDGADKAAGSFIILDDDGADRDVLHAIVARFGYHVVFVKTAEDLLAKAMEPGVSFILVNLGARTLDLNGMVRRYYGNSAVRSIPVLAYKDMREGVFVHELVGGLNRLTRYILSREELFSLLVDLLYRKEVIPLVAALRNLTDFDANVCYDTETLSQAFFQCEKNIFGQKDLQDDDTLAMMMKSVQGLNRVILKAEGLKWLRMNISRKDINTAGREG
ncbi:MAG: hypothetical protein KA369_20880 [Spirochaetes bacterium]|nr:hypothetical protein [Spirochaetota bacterium]